MYKLTNKHIIMLLIQSNFFTVTIQNNNQRAGSETGYSGYQMCRVPAGKPNNLSVTLEIITSRILTQI